MKGDDASSWVWHEQEQGLLWARRPSCRPAIGGADVDSLGDELTEASSAFTSRLLLLSQLQQILIGSHTGYDRLQTTPERFRTPFKRVIKASTTSWDMKDGVLLEKLRSRLGDPGYFSHWGWCRVSHVTFWGHTRGSPPWRPSPSAWDLRVTKKKKVSMWHGIDRLYTERPYIFSVCTNN